MADPARGACCDGLTRTGVNMNEGAESTLMWLIAAEHIRAVRTDPVRRVAPRRGAARDVGAVTRPEPLFRRDAANPILSAADVPYPANSVFNPAAARVEERDDPPRPRRGPPRDLAAPRGPQRRTASPIGDSIPSRSSRQTSIGIPRRPGAARIRGSPGCPSARSGRSPTRPTAAAGRSSGSRPPATSGASVASGRSCHPRTRTPPSSLAASTVAGR